MTFALREALYGLDQIAGIVGRDYTAGALPAVMEALMLDHPGDWAAYYHGAVQDQHLQRHFSYSDRIRYYWTDARTARAVADLLALLADRPLPEPLISQYLAGLYPSVMSGAVPPPPPP